MSIRFVSKRSEVFPNMAAMFSLMLWQTGASQLVWPGSALELWQFPSPSTESSGPDETTAATSTTQKDLVHGLIRREAVRNMALGFVGLATWYRGDRKLLGGVMLCGCFTAFSDGLVSRAVVGGEELRHWAFVPFMLGTAAGLLGWLG
ncbi:hypothetical protein PG993_007137 [Apiospora rasikravindrae]|uniref:Uncharacterized protein n=1 Tax=Apiospora rasikravindrae TaxID=990691 RepID=A0ABR1SWN0_9PEZI